jgi:CxxC motif-containing protein
MNLKAILLYLSLYTPLISLAQGTSCATPIPIPLDGVCRNYTVSSSTGGNLVCTSSGTTPITYFSVTTNSAAEDMMLNITGPGGLPAEVAMYGGTACNNGNLEPESSICFYDGTGIWAPAETYVPLPNKTYILRIKTGTTGTIQICGKSYTPPNDDCFGATPIGTLLINDNNACHKPGPGVLPGELCAPILQNTAFYYYTVELTGESAISIENTACDNNYESNGHANGYQFGLFTGTCSSLTYLTCYVGTAINAQVYTGVLNAGTRVYVAINGVMGSNCTYSLRGLNAMVLSATLKYFTAWKVPEGNILKWVSLREFDNKSFDVQRSVDGVNFVTIGNVAGQINSNTEKNYQFSDFDAPEHCFYRLKENSTTGKQSYSNVIEVNRADLPQIKIKMNNPVSRMLNMTLYSSLNNDIEIHIRNMSGQVISQEKISCKKGVNTYFRDFSSLPVGRYIITASMDGWKDTQSFIKIQ